MTDVVEAWSYVLFAVGYQAVDLPRADPAGPVCDLPVQVRQLDHISIHDSQRAHPSAGEVCRGRASEATGADEEDSGGFETFLAWKVLVSKKRSSEVKLCILTYH